MSETCLWLLFWKTSFLVGDGGKQIKVCMVMPCITIRFWKQTFPTLWRNLGGYSRMKVAALLFYTSSSSEPTSSILGCCVLFITSVNSSKALWDNYFFLSLNEERLPLCKMCQKVTPNSLELVFLTCLTILVSLVCFPFVPFTPKLFWGGEGNPKTTLPIQLWFGWGFFPVYSPSGHSGKHLPCSSIM